MKRCGGAYMCSPMCPAHHICQRYTGDVAKLKDNWIVPEWDEEKEGCPNFIRKLEGNDG